MEQLRHLPRTIVLPAMALLAGLFALAVARVDDLSDVARTDAVGSFGGIAIGLVVAALVISRVGARR